MKLKHSRKTLGAIHPLVIIVFLVVLGLSTVVLLFAPKDHDAKTPQPSPVFVLNHGLVTNWEANVLGGYDSNRPMSVILGINGTRMTNWVNLTIRQATVTRSVALGFRDRDGTMITMGGVLGVIVQTNGVDSFYPYR